MFFIKYLLLLIFVFIYHLKNLLLYSFLRIAQLSRLRYFIFKS
nr:MAG TPA: hypothetical protein [Caudoviricetes sp.]